MNELLQRLLDNFDADMEHGVAWMNDEASVKFAKEFPRLLESIVEVREYLNTEPSDEEVKDAAIKFVRVLNDYFTKGKT